MTFNYITDIPLATNNPSTDQPNMKQDTNAIDAWTKVDHVGFNLGTAGQHKQVTFNANISPGVPAGAVGIEYVNLVTGVLGNVTSLFFKNSTTDLPLTNVTLTTTTPLATGFGFRSAWGLIFNFGFVTISGNPTTVKFQVPMNNAQYAMLLGTSSNNASRTTSSNNFNATDVQLFASPTGTGCYFLAIGA